MEELQELRQQVNELRNKPTEESESEITERRHMELEREATIRMLEVLNAKTSLRDLMRNLLLFMRELSGCEAVGIRLRDGNDFPYYEVSGFSDEFVKAEMHLCVDDLDGQLERDEAGNPVLDCMCGNIICGRFDPSKSFFTDHGSFMSNCTTELLASTTDEDRQARTRNRCNAEGYESVFLVPLRTGGVSFGLLQFNDHRKGWFSPQFVAQAEHLADNVSIALAQRRAEEALKESEEKFRTVADYTYDWEYWISPSGDLVYVSPSCERISGYSADEFMHNPRLLQTIVHPDDAHLFAEHLQNVLMLDKYDPIEFRIVTKSKDVRWIDHMCQHVFDSDGKNVGRRGSNRDITETKRLQELESRAGRLETAGTIAGQVAHDFNNLLAPLMAYPEFIREELPHDHKALPYVDDIEEAAKKIADINQELLILSRRGYYSKEILDLNQIVLRAAREGQARTPEVIFETRMGVDLMHIKGGNAQIHRILNNLLTNASDATQNTGTVTIRTENYYADDTSIAFGRVPKGEYVKLTITDTGCGIPEEIIEKIIDPFFTTKATDKIRGSGLGLSVVDSVMKDHDGYIDISSTVGQGTSFYLYFPVSRESVSGGGEPNTNTGGNETILVVDDDEIQREVSVAILGKLGYNVTTVESGEKAVEFLRDNPQDLLVLDMIMPGGIDGAETYRQILEINPCQKAIIASGFAESERAKEAQELGAGAFIKKPLTRQVIAVAVRTELDRPANVLA